MKRKATVTGANILFFIFAMLFIFFQIVLIVLSAVFGEDFADKNIYQILLVNEFVLIFIPVIIYVIAKKINVKETFRLKKLDVLPAGLIILISLPAYFVAMLLNSIIIYILQYVGDIPNQPIPVPKNAAELITGILIVAVSPAICEEMLHRGIILKAYENRGSLKAVFITAIFFGFFHFDITNFLGPIFLGILIGYYVIRTNSIFAGVLAHFMNNTIAELLQFFQRDSGIIQKKITITAEELLWSVLWGAVGLIITGLLLKLFRNITEGKYALKPSISGIKDDVISIVSHWPVILILILYFIIFMLYILTIVISKAAGI